ncbi:MAG: XRE family transcriptional regulator [Pseudonocardiaceae bacterium]|nr:MAG: XRE family transcriptional regulator [Pseudonocardiaceae bacterium]
MPTDDRQLLAAGIRRALMARNLTAGDAARRLNLGTSTVTAWQLGNARPSPENFRRFCSALDFSPDDIAAGLPGDLFDY